jgi:hypothetical protein
MPMKQLTTIKDFSEDMLKEAEKKTQIKIEMVERRLKSEQDEMLVHAVIQKSLLN